MASHTTLLHLYRWNADFYLRVNTAAYHRYLRDPESMPLSSVVRSRLSTAIHCSSKPSPQLLFWALRARDEREAMEVVLQHSSTHELPTKVRYTERQYRKLIDGLVIQSYSYSGRMRTLLRFLNRLPVELSVSPRFILSQWRRLQNGGYDWFSTNRGDSQNIHITVPQAQAKDMRIRLQKQGKVLRQSRPLVRKGGSTEVRFEASGLEETPSFEKVTRSTPHRQFQFEQSSKEKASGHKSVTRAQKIKNKIAARTRKSRYTAIRRERNSKRWEQNSWTYNDT